MKRTLSMLLMLVMVLLMAAPAYAEEPVKITALTIKTDAGSTAAYDYVEQQMMERYGVECEVISVSGYDQVKMSFEGGDIPTLVYVDDLWQQTLQKYGYFQDITGMVEEYGWIEKSVPGAVEFNNLRTPGQYYSVATLMAPIVVYYNADIFAELGVEEPATYAEMEEIMAKAKEAGYYSFEVDGSNMYNILWTIYNMIFTSAGMEDVNKWYYLEETTDAFKEALQFVADEVVEWRDKGYIREEILGIDGTMTVPMFSMGQTAMYVTGDWDLSMVEQTGLNLGTFAFPVVDETKPLYIVNATDGAWAITTSADEAQTEAAGKFIDLFFEQETTELWVAAGYTPSNTWDLTQIEMSDLKKDMMAAVSQAGIGFYLDNTVPGMLDVVTKTMQQLISGEFTAEGYVEALLGEYETLKANHLSTIE